MRESWLWLLRTKVLSPDNARMTALDVGCGPGLVMELFSPLLDVQGVDIDPLAVREARKKGLEVCEGDAMRLPFCDRSFDVVYCSFTMLWMKDAAQAMSEMARVARGAVVCLAEPDYGGGIYHPPEVAALVRHLIKALQEEGADPFVGRKLGWLMERAGLDAESGTHGGQWSPAQLRAEAAAEWESLEQTVRPKAEPEEMKRAKAAWDAALAEGTLFLHNPIFYAIGRK